MIDILMSTYNGARFLAEQIDSIVAQDLTEFRLLVRDDGSGDETREILASYAARESRLKVISDDLGNLGASGSFFELISRSDADFTMLADQDDVWLPNKISGTVAKMNELIAEHGNQKPLAVFTDLRVVDGRLNTINNSFWSYQKLDPAISRDWKRLLAQNVVTGCTLLLNKAARSVITPFSLPGMMHDHWIAARIAKHGTVSYLSEPTVLYRQHGRNVEGARSFGIAYVASRIPRFFRALAFYRSAARAFGDVTTAELIKNKVKLNLKRLS